MPKGKGTYGKKKDRPPKNEKQGKGRSLILIQKEK